MAKPTITQTYLHSILNYDPVSGAFTWRVRKAFRTIIGAKAGRVTKLGYCVILIDRRNYMAHRLAWLYVHGNWPNQKLDHIDRDKQNNAISNLREATQAQNCYNRKRAINSTSGFKGVTYRRSSGKWNAQIGCAGKRFNLGLYDTPEAAHQAYCDAAKHFHGDFYCAG